VAGLEYGGKRQRQARGQWVQGRGIAARGRNGGGLLIHLCGSQRAGDQGVPA
jgi:hypothetical protein